MELHKELDQVKIERNDILVKQAQDVEEERSKRRLLSAENDKLKMKIKVVEDEVHKANLQIGRAHV